MFKRLPYGNSNFGKVIEENFCYIDKTRFIELLENETNSYQFFIRPRKFGKSLFFSTLLHYYDLDRAGDFEKLFGDLYIGKKPTPRKNSYAVMEFNFSGINTSGEDEFKVSFSQKIQDTVLLFIGRYSNLIPGADDLIQKINEEKRGINSLEIAYRAAKSAGVKIYVLIDEYDHFANDLIAMGSLLGDDVYRRMMRANGMVRDLYETLKIGTSDVVDRIFITGISPVMLDDLTSGFNIADNLSLKLTYNEMMGFTREEVDAMMVATGVNPDHITVDMSMYYDGYLFHEDGENRVYNPSMVLYFFKQVLDEKKPPKNIIDDNLKTDYGRLQRLVKNDENRERLLEIVKENGIISDIISKFSIDRLEDTEYFVSLLFYMGLLTIDKFEMGSIHLKIPNYTIRTIYWEYIVRLTQDLNKDVLIDMTNLKAAIRELAYQGNPVPYVDYVSKNVFSRLSNRDLVRFDEKYIKILLLNGLFQSRLYVPVSEMEVEEGYIDIWLERSPLLPDIKYEWVWEVKYLKKEEESQLPDKKAGALAQLKKYRGSERFKDRTDVRYAALLFTGKDRYEIIEP
ncbi:MAG: AAA family ATPase [Mangrovibacterium sp.]